MNVIVSLETTDVRFPTSKTLDGSDAMNLDPDYSAAYVQVHTDSDDGHVGHGFVFTIGRGNEIEISAIRALEPHLLGQNLDALLDDMGATSRSLMSDSQLRWLEPEKGVMHMAIGAVVNALWDLKAKRAGLPLWQLLAQMSPEEIADLVDFTYLSNALTRDEAVEILRSAQPHREARIGELLALGYPAYTTSPGWLGYDDVKLERLASEAVAAGFQQIKLKVGANLEEDTRRLRLARKTVGPNIKIAIDANQRWEAQEAIDWISRLAEFDLEWVEEPTSPDDLIAHATIADAIHPIPVATGEHIHNRIMFKQFLQARSLSVVQIDATRVGGVNENIAILLLAAKFGVRVCPHAGGVGLCEQIQHLAMFDMIAVSGSSSGRVIEYVDHLHEHFVDPVVVVNGAYRLPTQPGYSIEVFPTTMAEFSYPDGSFWSRASATPDAVTA